MINEEAIKRLKNILIEATETEDSICYVTSSDADALKAAIQALEQQSCDDVLDKIRAEIEKLRPNLRPEQMTDYDYAMVDVVNDIVAIIDKYKVERSDKR